MKFKKLFKIFILFFILMVLYSCFPSPYVDSQSSFAPKDVILDRYDNQEQLVDCQAYRDLKIEEHFGHCYYYDKANLQVKPNTDGNSTIVEYRLEPIYDWGNWFSIRKTSLTPSDLSQYSGVKLRIRAIRPADAILRISIADFSPKMAPYATDELWWCDFKDIVNDPKGGNWKMLVCPFNTFTLSSGFGSRQNDQELDLHNIIGFEVSILTQAKDTINSSIEIGGLAVYK